MTPNPTPAPEPAKLLSEERLKALRRAHEYCRQGLTDYELDLLFAHIAALAVELAERQQREVDRDNHLKTIAFAWRGLTYKLCDGPVCRCCKIDALSITGSQLPDRHLPNCHVLLLDKALAAALAPFSTETSE